MSGQDQGGHTDTQIGAAQSVDRETKNKKHWWQHNPIRRLSFQRNRSTSDSSDCTMQPPESPTKTEPVTEKKKGDRRYSVGDSIERHVEKRERWSRQYDVPSELFIPPWF